MHIIISECDKVIYFVTTPILDYLPANRYTCTISNIYTPTLVPIHLYICIYKYIILFYNRHVFFSILDTCTSGIKTFPEGTETTSVSPAASRNERMFLMPGVREDLQRALVKVNV